MLALLTVWYSGRLLPLEGSPVVQARTSMQRHTNHFLLGSHVLLQLYFQENPRFFNSIFTLSSFYFIDGYSFCCFTFLSSASDLLEKQYKIHILSVSSCISFLFSPKIIILLMWKKSLRL